MRECIIVLGMHRSGTSVLSGLVSLFGYELGYDVMAARADNPKGFFENNQVYQLNQRILIENGHSWDTYNFSIDHVPTDKYMGYLRDAKNIIKKEYALFNQFFIKDPRICLLFPLWAEALASFNIQVKCVVVYRNPLEVAYSLKARNEFPLQKSFIIWSHHFFQAEKTSRDYKRIILSFNHEFSNINALLDKLSVFLEKEKDDTLVAKAHEFYTPKLKNQNSSSQKLSFNTPKYLSKLYEALPSIETLSEHDIDTLSMDFYTSTHFFLYDRSFFLDWEREEEKKRHLINLNAKIRNLNADKNEFKRQLLAKDLVIESQEKSFLAKDKIKESTLKNIKNQHLQEKDALNKTNHELIRRLLSGDAVLDTVVNHHQKHLNVWLKRLRKKNKNRELIEASG